MKKLITICLLLFVVFFGNAQNELSDLIAKLNTKIERTSRIGINNTTHPAFTVEIYFDEKGGHYSYSDSRGGWYTYKWEEYSDIALTTQNRVMLYANDTYNKTYELITPKSGINGNEIIKLLDEIIYQKTGKSISIYTAVLKDENDITPVTYPVADNVANTQEYATGEAIVTVLEGLSYFNWEFVGRSTFGEVPSIYDDPNKPIPYDIDDARFNFILGKNHFRFNISPVGFSWLTLPDFTKYNEQNIKIGAMPNYTPRFFTPSVGLSYVLYPKSDKDDKYRIFEFPLSVHFAPFLSVKNDGYEMNDYSDSEYMEYFSDFNFYIYTSFGVSLHFADWIGLNLKAGAFYLNIKESDNVMRHTSPEGISESFKVKFDEKSKILPAGELSLTIRF